MKGGTKPSSHVKAWTVKGTTGPKLPSEEGWNGDYNLEHIGEGGASHNGRH